METVKEVSRRTGVSVRTLHHYDAIGLLKPTAVTAAGYRLYDGNALRRLQTILLFRELQFPLREIKAILDSPVFDPAEALAQQITLLEMERERLEGLISLARRLQENGVETMEFDAFDRSRLEDYKTEAKAKWGDTAAWREYEARQEQEPPQQSADGLMTCFARLGTLRGQEPGAPEVQRAVAALQEYITAHYYTCTREILSGLGEMYEADPRFRRSIDTAGGEGTAAFVRRAIAVFCQ